MHKTYFCHVAHLALFGLYPVLACSIVFVPGSRLSFIPSTAWWSPVPNWCQGSSKRYLVWLQRW